jgi:hypothetical protein
MDPSMTHISDEVFADADMTDASPLFIFSSEDPKQQCGKLQAIPTPTPHNITIIDLR